MDNKTYKIVMKERKALLQYLIKKYNHSGKFNKETDEEFFFVRDHCDELTDKEKDMFPHLDFV